MAPGRMKNVILLIGSLIFYAWGEPVYILLMLFSTIVDYSLGRIIGYAYSRSDTTLAKLALISSVAINIGILIFFKYSGLVPLPIGVSFYTFQTMSYTIDCYRKEIKVQKNILDFAVFVTMFPQLIAGPIVKYRDIENDIHERSVSITNISYGCKRFIYGLAKKVLIANNMGLLWTTISEMDYSSLPALTAWIGILAYAIQIYFDFSGYSDMAIGLGSILGFHFPENFNYPYISKSITEFWRRWHMTLGSWFREYVYIPLGGNRKGISRQLVNILIVWMLTGVWHGAGWNFVLWGLWFAFWLILEKLFLLKTIYRLPGFIQNLYALIIVLISWTFFAIDNGFGSYILALFGANGAGFANSVTAFYGIEYIVMFIISFIAATPIIKTRLYQKLTGHIETLILIILLIASIAYIVDASYNPFLYFRF